MNWRNVASSFAIAAAGIGGLGLAGWVFEVDTLKRLHPGLVTMKPNTAFCLLLAGLAIVLLRREDSGRIRRRVARTCAAIIGGVGLLTFGEHLNWWDAHIDHVLFYETQTDAGRSVPGRMGPASALNFMLLSMALLLLDSRPRRRTWPAQGCALAVITITCLIFLTYFYAVEVPKLLAIHLSIALHTVIAFLLLATAILLSRPDRGITAVILADNIGGVIARRMLPAAILLPAFIGWVCALGRDAGLYGRGMDIALLAASLTLIFTSLVWWAAKALATADSARRRLAAIVDSSVDAILSKTLEGIVTSWNAGAERLFGYTAEEMIGQPITKIIPVDRRGEEVDILNKIRAGQDIEHFETVRMGKGGRALDVSLSISPVRNEMGVIVGASKIVRDITERRRDALALAQAHAEAEAANRAKDDFLAVLSHELRTPLTPALMAVTDLESAPSADPAVLRESLALIRRNIELEARLVDDLLDLTRISHGKLRITSAPVDLQAVLRDALAIASPMLQEKRIVVVSELNTQNQFVRGDATRLAQVFSNVLTNAAKFTPEAGRVTIRSTNTGEGEVCIEVTDTGIGIAPDVLANVFEAFRQEGPGTTRRFGGLGLGLSVAKGLVQAHGGSIAAYSEGRNCGTTIAIKLPTLAPSEVHLKQPAPAPCGPARSLRVLLVEDHDDTRHVLERLISRAGHRTTSAGSVAEARQALASGAFDFLLTDLGLPDGSGFDVIAALRERSDIPAAAMSGYGMNADLARTRAAGFNEHITKPVSADVLRRLLGRFASPPETQDPPDPPAGHDG